MIYRLELFRTTSRDYSIGKLPDLELLPLPHRATKAFEQRALFQYNGVFFNPGDERLYLFGSSPIYKH